jgi:pterin-4a-carbinolamine dehydratase
MTDRISPKQFHESEGVEDWRVIGDGACAYFRTGSFAASVRLVQAINQLPGVEDHKPDVDLRHDGVTVRLITYTDNYYGMSQRDVEMARQISAAALGYEPRRDSPAEDLVDPRGRRRRDPRRDMGAVRACGDAHRGCAGCRRPHGARRVRSVVVDAG